MTIQDVKAYEILDDREVKDLNSRGLLLKHKKSGAKLLILSNDDENKVFSIGFRTPPEDSTGLPHILEHSVLCGSRNFPAKDPFVELVKGSLNTFLNAMTYPDKTVYPVASCNDKDFQNLMHVYMDAVFYPNIYKKEEIFRQEGWHYELERTEGPLKVNGVVYNEMKGAFSSPEDVLDREVLRSLFPDTSYANESGGDPEFIPDLTYEQFLDFHKKYYHPSNSFLYLYGNMDVAEKLDWLDREYLSAFDAVLVDSAIRYQKPFEKPVEVTREYSITEAESTKDQTYLSYSTVVDTSLNKELYLAFQVLEYALLSAPGAPLKQALIDAGIGKDVMGSYDEGVYQPTFSVISKNANPEQKEEFLRTIRDTLSGIVEKGMDKQALLAGINYYEFRFREADFGNYPKGLMYGLQAFDSWLYDENQPFMHLEALDTFRFLKEQVGRGYYEQLIQKYLIENTHASVVMIVPRQGLTAQMEQKTADKLEKYRQSLDEARLQQMVEDTVHLEEYQSEETPEEDLEKIPMLRREDIGRQALPLCNEEQTLSGIPVLYHELFTNGIAYINLVFDTCHVPDDLLPYLGLLKSVLGYMDTENYSYAELFNVINIHSGGIYTALNPYADVKEPDQYKGTLQVKAKVLYDKLDFAFTMIREILFATDLSDDKRLYEIIAQVKSRLQMGLTGNGHSTAAIRAMSYFSPSAYFNDCVGGIGLYRLVESIESDFDAQKDSLKEKLRLLMQLIFRPENLMVDYTAEREGLQGLEDEIGKLSALLYQDPVEKCSQQFRVNARNEGFKTSAQVQYVARAGNFVRRGYEYTGALKILKVILSYDYLWINIRVKGGAYGCMSGFNRVGDGYLVSYRDPNLKKTNEIFEGTAEFVKNFTVSDRDMTKYIIGTIGDLDSPLTPSSKGNRSMTAYLSNLTYEDIQKEREQVLTATEESIRDLAGIIEAVLADGDICVLGNETRLEEQKEMFTTLCNLFS